MRIDKMSYNRNFGDKRKKIPKSNPFAKAVTVKEPYAIYLSPDRLTEYSVLQTYIHPNRENGDSEWLVAERTMMFASLADDYKLKIISRGDVNCHSLMVSCSNEWKQSYIN